MIIKFLNLIRSPYLLLSFCSLAFVPGLPLQAEPVTTPATSQNTTVPPVETNPVTPEAIAAKPLIYEKTVNAEMDDTYKKVFTALENNGYYVIFEPNLGKNLSLFASRWGEEYNKNKINSIRSMVFCNGWYANRISNIDPKLLALCPLHVTLYTKDSKTHILFVRPGKVGQGSEAEKVAHELENDVIRAIESATAN